MSGAVQRDASPAHRAGLDHQIDHQSGPAPGGGALGGARGPAPAAHVRDIDGQSNRQITALSQEGGAERGGADTNSIYTMGSSVYTMGRPPVGEEGGLGGDGGKRRARVVQV